MQVQRQNEGLWCLDGGFMSTWDTLPVLYKILVMSGFLHMLAWIIFLAGFITYKVIGRETDKLIEAMTEEPIKSVRRIDFKL